MRSNIDFELAYENCKATVNSVVNSRYFPKNILLRIWNSPYFWMKRDLIRFVVWIPVMMIVVLVEILAALQRLWGTLQKYKTMPQAERREFRKIVSRMVIFAGLFTVIYWLVAYLTHNFQVILLPVSFLTGCVLYRYLLIDEIIKIEVNRAKEKSDQE